MKNLLLACVIAFLWALWPILAQKFGKGHYVYTFICLGTLVAVGITQWIMHKQSNPIAESGVSGVMSFTILLIPLGLGLLNGIAMNLYPVLLGNVTKPGTWVAIVTALISIMAVIIGAYMSQSISVKEVIGMVIVIVGVVIMSDK